MKAKDATIGAQLATAEMISSGTIGFVDQYFFADEIAEVVYQSGMKALINPSIFDGKPMGFHFSLESSYRKNLEVINKWHRKDDRVFVGFGPHAPYSVPDDYYQKIYEQAEKYDTKIHTHLNETKQEVDESKKAHGKSPIQKMQDLGVLDRIVAAHCIHLDENDKQLLVQHHIPVLHNIQSNLKIGAGIANIPDYISRGIIVCLGTDGNASNNNLDMLEEVRLTALIHKGLHGNPKLIPARTALKMGTENASSIFPPGIYSGKLLKGEPADLLVVDLDRINTTPIINPLSNWVYSANSSNVALTMSNGKILYSDNKFQTLNVERIKEQAQKSIERMMIESDYQKETP